MLAVTPIAVTSPDFKTLIAITNQVLGRHLAKSLDSKNISTRNLAYFIGLLAEFQVENSDPIKAQREAGSLLRHISVSFLVCADRDAIFQILIDAKVAVIDCEDNLYILTANLEGWRTTVINYTSPNASIEMKMFLSAVLIEFDKLGLSLIFDKYSRQKDTKGLITLKPK